ncbi:MAG: hypothetical protein ABI769_18570 [Pseudomonadota bacterium]
MKEREATRRYLLELGIAMVLYLAVLFGSITIAKSMETGFARTLLLATPLVPIVLAVWAIARQFRRMDEFVRLRSLESLAIAAGVTAGLSLTYGFLESAGFPKLSMFWVWPVMGAVWGLHSSLRCVFSR